MTSDVAIPQSFDERILNMFRENLGGLMTEEELKKIAERSLETLFFKDRPGDYSSSPRKPPLALELLTPEIKKIFEGVMQQWVADNQELIQEEFKKYFGTNAQQFAINMIGTMFGPVFDNLRAAVSSETYSMIRQNQPNSY